MTKVLIGCMALFIGSVSALSNGADFKYLREDCIARIEIAWENESSADKEKTIRFIVEKILRAPKYDFNKVSPDMASRGENREFIYLQYKFDCVNKEENTRTLIAHFQDLVDVRLTVSKGRFFPGVDTIRSYGEWWSDNVN